MFDWFDYSERKEKGRFVGGGKKPWTNFGSICDQNGRNFELCERVLWFCPQIWKGICPVLWLDSKGTSYSYNNLYQVENRTYFQREKNASLSLCLSCCKCVFVILTWKTNHKGLTFRRDQDYACSQNGSRIVCLISMLKPVSRKGVILKGLKQSCIS